MDKEKRKQLKLALEERKANIQKYINFAIEIIELCGIETYRKTKDTTTHIQKYFNFGSFRFEADYGFNYYGQDAIKIFEYHEDIDRKELMLSVTWWSNKFDVDDENTKIAYYHESIWNRQFETEMGKKDEILGKYFREKKRIKKRAKISDLRRTTDSHLFSEAERLAVTVR